MCERGRDVVCVCDVCVCVSCMCVCKWYVCVRERDVVWCGVYVWAHFLWQGCRN